MTTAKLDAMMELLSSVDDDAALTLNDRIDFFDKVIAEATSRLEYLYSHTPPDEEEADE